MNSKLTSSLPEKKVNAVKEISDLIKDKNTILIASIKNLPASQFQAISKKLRSKAVVKVPKKSLMLRAIDQSKNEELKKLKEEVDDSTAILFSDIDGFELASELLENKTPAKAKIGQEAPEDIEVEAGPTDLVPGPAISELGALGIQIQIDKGKINIKEPKVIVKKGEKISEGAASIMNKLDIKPFAVGFIPLSSFDLKSGKLYSEINIDKAGTLNSLKEAFGKALAFAVEIGNVNSETLKFILAKAVAHENALDKLIGENVKEENKEEKKESESSEENTEKEEETQAPEVNAPQEEESSGEKK